MLDKSISSIKGVGPKRQRLLNNLGIFTINDILNYYPREFEDRSEKLNLADYNNEDYATLEIVISGNAKTIRPNRRFSILKFPFIQENICGELVWFNQDYIKYNVFPGRVYNVYGKIKKVGQKFEIHNPIIEPKGLNEKIGRLIPRYNLTEGITNNQIINIINEALKSYISYIDDSLPKHIIEKYKLISKQKAILNIHKPKDKEALELAKRRLIFEELFYLQLGLFWFKNINGKKENTIKFDKKVDMTEFFDTLSFNLTKAQKRAIKEIEKDMESTKKMNRLLQGDVGSGKTVVAVASMFKAVKNGFQVAMMVPTEVLATQQYMSIKNNLQDLGIKVEILIGSMVNKDKEAVKNQLLSGKIDIIIGTHALIQEDVKFDNLGLVITDEQHRFGVRQREVLNNKGNNPDCLYMTATPIPRTLAYILYGDLDISIIDELPPNRKRISTFSVGVDYIDRINIFIDKEIQKGRQVYIVAPLVEDSKEINAYSVESLYNKYSSSYLNKYNIKVVHGKLNSKEKDAVMEEFKNGNIDILISTTVIEVGVNVPNASIMVIYNAERFGLAQLHQLRGRVGRGEHKSYCILINQNLNEISLERMKIMIESEDGFEISEKDLELRGPGEFFGTRQHGIPELKIANLFLHSDMLRLVQYESREILNKDPLLSNKDNVKMKTIILDLFKSDILDKRPN